MISQVLFCHNSPKLFLTRLDNCINIKDILKSRDGSITSPLHGQKLSITESNKRNAYSTNDNNSYVITVCITCIVVYTIHAMHTVVT